MVDLRQEIMRFFADEKTTSIMALAHATKTPAPAVRQMLIRLKAEGLVVPQGRSKWTLLAKNFDPAMFNGTVFLDYGGVLAKLRHAYRNRMNAILIGPAGVGKSSALKKLCEMEGTQMLTTNFSLRTREHHFVGRLDPKGDGTLQFKDGPLVVCMKRGWVWYGDELNTAEADSLVKLDMPLDFRREIEVEGEIVKADEKFWACASVNPLDRYHPGTKELPGQIIRRFPIRIYIGYPPASTEYEIVKLHVPEITSYAKRFMEVIFSVAQMREQSGLPYHPTVSDSIAIARLITNGISLREALRMTLIDVYAQWGQDVSADVIELIRSRMGESAVAVSVAPQVPQARSTMKVGVKPHAPVMNVVGTASTRSSSPKPGDVSDS